MRSKNGFTLIELLVVIALSAILATVTFIGIGGYKASNDLKRTGEEVIAALRNTRQRSISQEDGLGWGMHFSNATSGQTYVSFGGTSYVSSTAKNAYTLGSGILFGNPPSSSSLDVLFSPITGDPSQNLVVSIVDGRKDGLVYDVAVNGLGSVEGKFWQGLVGYWPLDEGTGTTAYDASGNGNNGTLMNSPTWQSGSSCEAGSCLSFNGTNSYVSTPINNANNTWTLSAWVKANQFTAGNDTHIGAPIIDSDYPSHFGTGFGIKSDGSQLMCIYNDGWCAFPYTFSTNTWYNLAVVYDRGAGKVSAYVNGSPIGSSTVTFANETTFNKFTLGKDPANNYYWNGTIDDVRIYNRALSAQDVQDLYNETQ